MEERQRRNNVASESGGSIRGSNHRKRSVIVFYSLSSSVCMIGTGRGFKEGRRPNGRREEGHLDFELDVSLFGRQKRSSATPSQKMRSLAVCREDGRDRSHPSLSILGASRLRRQRSSELFEPERRRLLLLLKSHAASLLCSSHTPLRAHVSIVHTPQQLSCLVPSSNLVLTDLSHSPLRLRYLSLSNFLHPHHQQTILETLRQEDDPSLRRPRRFLQNANGRTSTQDDSQVRLVRQLPREFSFLPFFFRFLEVS